MKVFLLASSCLLILMFFSVSLGIRMAENGLEHMRGKSDLKTQNNVTIERTNWFTSIEEEKNSHNIYAKKKILENMNTFNLFSFMGKEMADGISKASRKIIRFVVH